MKPQRKSPYWGLDYETYLFCLNERYQARLSPWYTRPFRWLWEHLIGIVLWMIYGSVDRYHHRVACEMADQTYEDLKALRAAKEQDIYQQDYYPPEHHYRQTAYDLMHHWNPLKRRKVNLKRVMTNEAQHVREWLASREHVTPPRIPAQAPLPSCPANALAEELQQIKEQDPDYQAFKDRILQLINDQEYAPSTSNADRRSLDKLKLMDDLAHMPETEKYGKRLFEEGVLWSPDLIACIDNIYHETPTGDEVEAKEECMKKYEEEKSFEELRWEAMQQRKTEQEAVKITPPESPRTAIRKHIIEPLVDVAIEHKRQRLT